MKSISRSKLLEQRGVRAHPIPILILVLAAPPAAGQSLRGSTPSLDLQNEVARQHDYTYIETSSQVRRFADAGYLVRVRGNADYVVKSGAVPYARPEVVLFLERLGAQYRAACGERLVATSLTRPRSRQPRNASPRSVHPTGMALDLRRSARGSCRSWLEGVLLHLEGRGVLEATYERRPPHYHVALFPTQYGEYVAGLQGSSGGGTADYTVRRGDSLWEIARDHGVSVAALRSANDLRGSRIYAGQRLTVPSAR
ncbi:MAG: DUF5715 family protein [Gemmatimonadota bacterium]|nr:DUF5715 family protein [Gemmatimonadota bacterium]